MKKKYLFLLLAGLIVLISKSSIAQIEARLATNCVIKKVEVPVILKNLERIKSFRLELLFDSDLLHFDTSLYHHSDFNNGNNVSQISVSSSNDTISIQWSSFNSIDLNDDLLLSLSFSEIGAGDVHFSWIEDECFFKNVDNLSIDADYLVDGSLGLPFSSDVEMIFEQFTIGCRDGSENGGCKAQAEVNIVGAVPPYQYQWNDKFHQKDSIAIGLCESPVSVQVSDAAGCVYVSVFDPIIYPASVYEIKAYPEEVFITKPDVEFSIQTSDNYIEKYEWDFGDGGKAVTEFATHTYATVGTYEVSLRTENLDGCDTTVSLKNFEVKELNFCIPNVFTPNGDGINDTWVFKIIGAGAESNNTNDGFKDTGLSDVKKCSGDDLIFADHFKSSHLVVFTRGGNRVYECTNCSNYWDGSGLSDGVYFYVFTWEGEYTNGKEQGNVSIIGSKK